MVVIKELLALSDLRKREGYTTSFFTSHSVLK